MLVLHIYVLGQNGSIERSYDFLRYDGKESFEGCDVIIPYSTSNAQPISEADAISLLAGHEIKGDH